MKEFVFPQTRGVGRRLLTQRIISMIAEPNYHFRDGDD
jgi:hypothetical protein